MLVPIHPIKCLQDHVAIQPDKIYYSQPLNGSLIHYTYAEVATQVAKVANFLQNNAIKSGDKVGLISKNCAQWQMADYAIWAAGCVSVPLYPTLPVEEMLTILNHAEVSAIFVGKLDNFSEVFKGMPKNLLKITFPFFSVAGENTFAWNEVLKMPATAFSPVFAPMDELATIIYTSGTTGEPKGVMHSFQGMMFAAREFAKEIKIFSDDRFISYLPLAHVAERMVTELIPLHLGAQVSFVDSLDTFVADIKCAKPTIFLAVPRIWEKFRNGVNVKIPRIGTLVKVPIFGKILGRIVLKGLGLDTVRHAGSGAAPIDPVIFDFFDGLGLRIQNLYGMTENFCYSHRCPDGPARKTSVGPPMPFVKARLGEDDEIQASSPATMLGYYKNPEETKASFKDGFFCTGDQGKIDAAGNYCITGRIKDHFKTAKGKFVSPEKIEKTFHLDEICEGLCVVGNGLTQPLLIANLKATCKEMKRETLLSTILEQLKLANSTAMHHEIVGAVIVVCEEWSLENGFATPTFKLKRREVAKKYAGIIKDAANGKDKVVVHF